MKKHLLILIIISKSVFSQSDSTKALVYFKEKGVVIYLDDKKIESQKKLKTILPGNHTVKAWAPNYELMEDTFKVLAGNNKFYTKKLHFSESYKAYRRKQNSIKLTYLIPAFCTLVSGFSYYKEYVSIGRDITHSHQKAQDIQNDYYKTFSYNEAKKLAIEYDAERDNYNSIIQKQDKLKKQGIIVTSSIFASAITLFIINKLRKHKPFIEKPLLSNITPSYNPLTHQICVTFKL